MAIKVIGDKNFYPGHEPDRDFEPNTYKGDGANDMIVGNKGNNYIEGGAGNDKLYGGLGDDMLIGGAGKDMLFGGKGADAFVFDCALGRGNVDRIADFSHAQGDKIMLDNAIFAALNPVIDPTDQAADPNIPITIGALDAKAFYVGGAAQNADQHILYNQKTGALSYDADGNGAAEAVKFAQLKAGTTLHHWDFIVS